MLRRVSFDDKSGSAYEIPPSSYMNSTLHINKKLLNWSKESSEESSKKHFACLSDLEIQQVEDWVDHKPLKVLHLRTPHEVFTEHIREIQEKLKETI